MSINFIWNESLSNVEVDGQLGEMASKVAVQNFDFIHATLLFFNSILCFGIETFLHGFDYNIIINSGLINPNIANITRQSVIFTSDITDLQVMLDTLMEMKMKNTGKFIIVCESRLSSDCDENEMTRLFWDKKMVDVVIIKAEEENVLGFTYFPISDGSCSNVKPVKLEKLNHSQKFTTNHGNIFGMKLKKLSFCPLIVSTFIQTPYMLNISNNTPIGADGDLLRVIAYGLNTSLVMRTPRYSTGWGFQQKNGTWLGSLRDIADDLANVSMTSAALTLSRFSEFQLSNSYYVQHIAWVTHPAIFQDEALKLLHPFGPSTRVALIVSYALVIVCAYVIKTDRLTSMCCKTQEEQISKSIVFYSWLICMGQAVIKLPTKSAFLQIIMLWICYCFIIRTAYQVYLISSLKGKFYDDQFETIEDAIKADYRFGGGAALRDYFIGYPEVHDHWITVDTADIVPTALNISAGLKFVLAMNMDTAKVLMKEHKVSLHILAQKVACSPTILFAKKYSPLIESLNVVLSRVVASGLPDKLHKKYTSINTVGQYQDNEQESLKTKHLTACYIVLLVGSIMSFVFFTLEFYFGKIYKHPVLPPE